MFYGIESQAQEEMLASCLGTLRDLFTDLYAADELIAVRRSLGFLRDERLIDAVAHAASSITDPSMRAQALSKVWRLHVLTWAASCVRELHGDYVECGAFDGFTAAVITAYLDFASDAERTYYLYDTFAGLSERYASEHELLRNEFFRRFPDVYDRCRARFAGMQNVRIVKGVVPDVLEECAPRQIAFLHIDLNCARAERGALDVLFDRVTPGGFVILDDYGRLEFRAQQEMADAFVRARGERILELPTGQGVIMRGRP